MEDSTLKSLALRMVMDDPTRRAVPLARLNTMLYLLDWHSALEHGRTETGVQWWRLLGLRGEEVRRLVESDPDFQKIPVADVPGVWRLAAATSERPLFGAPLEWMVRYVLRIAEENPEPEFTGLANSTFPFWGSEDGDILDLESAALEYKSLFRVPGAPVVSRPRIASRRLAVA